MVFFKQFQKHKETLLLLLIILLAAFLRLYRIGDYMTFLGDEGRDVLVAYNILHGHFTLLGPTASVGGFFFGPVYYYMMAPFLWLFNYSPVGPAVMVGIIGTITVWLVYKTGKAFFNIPVGLLAAFFYAISPLVISYSRSSWNPNPLPFFSLLAMLFAYRAGVKKRMGDFLLSGFFLGIAIELHFITTFLGAVLFIFLLYRNFIIDKQKRWVDALRELVKEYLIVFAGFLLGMLPYLAFEVRHQFSNTRSIIAFIFHSKDTGTNAQFFQTIGDVFFRLFGHLVTNFPTADHTWMISKPLLMAWGIFTIGLAVGGIGLLIIELRKTKKHSGKNLQYSLLLLWLFVGILLFGFYKKNIYDYYFTFLFPLPFLLTANLLYVLWTNSKSMKILSAMLFSALFVLLIQGIPFRYEPNRQLLQTETISRFVLDKTGNKPFNFALITGGNSDHAYRYFFTIWGHPPVMIDNTIHDPKRKTVTDQLLVVCESLPCYPLGHSLFEIAGFGRADIVGHWKVSVVEVYKLVPYKGR